MDDAAPYDEIDIRETPAANDEEYFFKNIFWGDFFFVIYSALLHLPPL
jgi:hypothetical protein